jgi:pyruvate formate lyase activating enzyme
LSRSRASQTSVLPVDLTRKPKDPGQVTGIVFNIQRYSIQDGPGIRTTVFLKGCPLRCAWCSNPESQNPWPEIAHRDSLCTGCGLCVDACSVGAISLDGKTISVDRTLCTDCGQCVEVCAPGALKLFGNKMTAEEVFREVEKDRDFYLTSGGGVTISGGEPLAQPDFTTAILRLCWEKGIHTCIETTGQGSSRDLEKILEYTALVLFDIKLADPAAHRQWTHLSNETIHQNLRLVVQKGVPVIIRVPLIPGVNDSEEELRNMAQLARDILMKPGRLDILPYHKYGMGKYQMLDRPYELEELNAPPDDQVQEAKKIFEDAGFECEIGG